jgi:DNA-directed RNA polymerase specialized sigma24 family protein
MDLITLVERAMQGDATAFSHLVTQHLRFVYTICLSQVGHATEAEDLTQEVFVHVYHDLAHLREPAKFLPWLRQVVRNECRMWRRRQPATHEPLDAVADVSDPVTAAQFRRSELLESGNRRRSGRCGGPPDSLHRRSRHPPLQSVAIGWLRLVSDSGMILGPLVMGAL